MTYYTIAMVENVYSYTVRRILDADMSKLEKFFMRHTYIENKEDAPLFSPWEYDDRRERNSESAQGTNLLVLDYDNANPIDDVMRYFHGRYIAMAYTTFSHRVHNPCYRVVIPLASYLTKEEVWQQNKNILAHFPQLGLDKTSLNVSRSFYVPSAPIGGLFEAKRSGGRIFDARDVFRPVKLPTHEMVISEINDNERLAAVFCLSRCKSLSEGGSEPLWFNIACAMYANGFSSEDFEHVSLATWPNQSTDKITAKWAAAKKRVDRGEHTSYGVIVNLIKRDGQYDWYINVRDSKVS